MTDPDFFETFKRGRGLSSFGLRRQLLTEDSLRATVGLTILKEIQWINIILADIRDGHVRDGRAGDRRFKAPTAFVIRA